VLHRQNIEVFRRQYLKSYFTWMIFYRATHIMFASGEKKILSRHNRSQRVAAAKQLLVPSATSDSASLNVKVSAFSMKLLCHFCRCHHMHVDYHCYFCFVWARRFRISHLLSLSNVVGDSEIFSCAGCWVRLSFCGLFVNILHILLSLILTFCNAEA